MFAAPYAQTLTIKAFEWLLKKVPEIFSGALLNNITISTVYSLASTIYLILSCIVAIVCFLASFIQQLVCSVY